MHLLIDFFLTQGTRFKWEENEKMFLKNKDHTNRNIVDQSQYFISKVDLCLTYLLRKYFRLYVEWKKERWHDSKRIQNRRQIVGALPVVMDRQTDGRTCLGAALRLKIEILISL